MLLETIKKKAFSGDGLSANFLGINTQKNKKMENFEFRYGIKNPTTDRVVYAITPGTFPRGYMGDNQLNAIKKEHPVINAIASDGIIYRDTQTPAKECTILVGGNKTFEHFKQFSQAHVFLIETIEMSSSDKNNLQAEVSFVRTNPFKTQVPENVRLAKWFSLAQQDQTRVIAKGINMPIGPDSMCYLTIEPFSEIDVVFTINVE